MNGPNADFLRWVKKHKLGGEKYPKFEKLNRGEKAQLTKLFKKLEKPFANPAAYVVRKTKHAKGAENAGFTRVGDKVIVHCAINEKVRITSKGVMITRPNGEKRTITDGADLFLNEKTPELKPGEYIRINSDWGNVTLTSQSALIAWLERYREIMQEGVLEGDVAVRIEIVTGRAQRMYNKNEREELSQAIESWNDSGRMRH